MRVMAAIALVLAGSGCALPGPHEIRTRTEVPFVASEREDDCGAGALGAALAAAGVPRTQEEIFRAVVEPGRGGAPTSAVVRYARAQGVFALARDTWVLDDLKEWVRAGVAPIVLLSTEPEVIGRFHYLLLRGFDDERRAVLLQEGRSPNVVMGYPDFFRRWCEARGFALVVADPGIELPAGECGLTAQELGALGWLAERAGKLDAARRHYRAAVARDPGFAAARHNLGNVERLLATSPPAPVPGRE